MIGQLLQLPDARGSPGRPFIMIRNKDAFVATIIIEHCTSNMLQPYWLRLAYELILLDVLDKNRSQGLLLVMSAYLCRICFRFFSETANGILLSACEPAIRYKYIRRIIDKIFITPNW